MGKTLFEKIWDQHVVTELPGGEVLLYIDRHLIHEVTSPQAFEGLKLNNRPVRHPELTFATTDHNVPTDSRTEITDPVARTQVNALESNCAEHDIRFYGMNSEKQGVVHIIGPEQGITLPGTTIVCGDSHTATLTRLAKLDSSAASTAGSAVSAHLQQTLELCEVPTNAPRLF